jgi:hypothetical protein
MVREPATLPARLQGNYPVVLVHEHVAEKALRPTQPACVRRFSANKGEAASGEKQHRNAHPCAVIIADGEGERKGYFRLRSTPFGVRSSVEFIW